MEALPHFLPDKPAGALQTLAGGDLFLITADNGKVDGGLMKVIGDFDACNCHKADTRVFQPLYQQLGNQLVNRFRDFFRTFVHGNPGKGKGKGKE
jgi:hypothetical protein